MDFIIYKDATKVRLILKTGVDLRSEILASPNGALILYRKPDATEGQWVASILTSYDGRIYKDFNDTEKFDQAGEWTLWAKLTFSDDRYNIGVPVFYNVLEQGDIP